MIDNLNPSLKKEDLLTLSLWSKIPISEIKSLFNVLVLLIICDYSEGKKTYLPNIGLFKFIKTGDKEVLDDKGKIKKKAIIEVEFEADNFLARNIALFEEGSTVEIYEKIFNNIQESLIKKIKP